MQLYRSLIPLAASNPHVHYAFLLCASTHLASQSGRRAELQLEQLRYSSKALLSVRQAISSASCFDVEALLTAMIFLAMNNDVSLEAHHDTNPFAPPFTDMQWLSHYARSELQPEHWKAIQIVVEKHGGAANLTVFAMPWLLSYAALIQSAISFSKPIYPLLQPDGRLYADIPTKAFLGEIYQAPPVSSGFAYLQSAGIPEKLVIVFSGLGRLSRALQMLSDGSVDRPYYDRIGDYRNLVQHRLLSLPTANDLREPILVDRTALQPILNLYDACRMTALLYSTHVTFPIPRTASQREDVVTSHRNKLLATGPHISQSTEALELLLWCTVIGGIASEHGTHRHWYTTEVKRLSSLCGVQSCLQLMETMERFAWMEKACQACACALWNAADGDSRITHEQ
ncbi:hypothetical protein TRIATDRAFT_53915 [Trichoderma atroviride IMI 206040]|uniref:Transcription factor domain-containing protein n=2 Tax=Hypocrea atroviridis TaxID=63577 RepID=G9NKZ4_HYPAI|nr:uncharacterized protein TRIATDRAFT_53915 [Trichoderma atroviride IMI 206040]EHK48563.1 hypothetical protein TRIATDRAFT_53915 [Trichoderma atroviride IMI 206040]